MTKEGAVTAAAGRLVSIDALRGFDMFWIIGGGDIIRELLNLILHPMPKALEIHFTHTKWQGFYGWDLIMPLFLFIVGTSLPFALSKRLIEQGGRRAIYKKIAKRFVILFFLGICVQGNLLKINLHDFHGYVSNIHLISNTLQAIAFGYVVAAVALLNLKIIWQAFLCFALLAGYWLLMFLVPFPGHAAGTLLPDANLALYIDQVILGRFRDGTSYTWILTGLSFSATVLLGVMAGHIMKSKLKPAPKFIALFGAGVFLLVAGLVAGHWFPIIKHIWTSSFALFVGGLSFLLLSFFYLLIDVIGFKKWSFFFVVIGANALAVYCFTELVNPYVGKFVEYVYFHAGIIFAAPIGIGSFALLWYILYVMYKKQIFIKV